MKYIIALFCLLYASLTLKGQASGDSILINERKIDRPLTLHKGQLQFNSAYEISVILKEFDNSSKGLLLSDKGTASVRHKYLIDLNYGILDFLQASVALNYSLRGERSESHRIWVTYAEQPDFYITSFDEYKGFDDLYIGTVIKLPLKTSVIEIALSPGFYLPLFSARPEAPEHSIQLPSVGQPVTLITYHNNHTSGKGSKALKIGAGTILRPGKGLSISAGVNYTWPVAVSETVNWIHQLSGSSFIYNAIDYKYLIGNTLDYEVSLAYQAISWFNLSLSWYSESTSSGWTEVTGFRIGNPESKVSIMTINYEIKATGRVWINQSASVALTGKNQLAPFSICLGLSYNLFPFEKRIKQGHSVNIIN
ncbi:MAG: hypothetical protein K0B05_06805 [Bacteroidales bacterium]|nr:hypothetical protein [Bacteroidales bacterium]